MNAYRYGSDGCAPTPSTLFSATAGWLAFIAIAMAITPAGTSSGLVITVGTAVAAAALAPMALPSLPIEETGVPGTPGKIRRFPRSPTHTGKAA